MEEYEPDDAEDEDGEPGRNRQKRKDRRTRFGLTRLGCRFNDVALPVFCRHDEPRSDCPHIVPRTRGLAGEPGRRKRRAPRASRITATPSSQAMFRFYPRLATLQRSVCDATASGLTSL